MSYTVEELQILMESFGKSGLTRFRYSTQEETLEFRNEPGTGHFSVAPAGREGMSAVSADTDTKSGTAQVRAASESDTASAGSSEDVGNGFGSGTGSSAGEKDDKAGGSPEGTVAVRAPLAGIFYRASKPGEKPYVEEGQSVKKGDIVGLVEAMKMMNEIPAPCDGIVREIKAKDAVFTGYDAVLMTIGEN